ncbi:MAG TPA: transglycosylase domain-containing protein, partial [Cytophagaceae bacterium]
MNKLKAFIKRHPWVWYVAATFFYIVFAFTMLYFILFVGIIGSIPDQKTLKSIENATASRIYSSDGIVLGKYFIEDRTNIEYKDLSPDLVHALIATEDNRFYEHNGVDTKGLLRVLFKTILMGDASSGGGSTLSQQLAKNLFPRQSYWVLTMPYNKLKESIIATKLEKVFTKEEIITLYLNTVSFGDNAYGIASASRRFFNTTPSKLKIQEAATLVGMLKATTSYNPRRNPEKSKKRRNVVLDQMVKYRYLERTKADSIKALPLKLKFRQITHSDGLAPYFREHLRQRLMKWCAEHTKSDGSNYNVYTDGLKIYTTINSKMQKYAELAVASHMKVLQKSFFDHWGSTKPWGENSNVVEMAIQRSERFQRLKEKGYSEEEIDKVFNTPIPMKVFSWAGELEKKMSPRDSVKYYLYYLQAGFMAMTPTNGHIKAWVGGINHKYFQYDHVNIKAKRQVGSTFKPIVYAGALEQGVSPCEYFPNDKVVYEQYENWSPGNSNDQYGGEYSMQGGLTHSVNTVSAQVILKAGIGNVIGLAKKMGIESPLEPVPSLSLGTADISLYEMLGAYGTFANRGNYVQPIYLLRIEDNDGNIIANFTEEQEKTKALSTDNNFMMVRMLQNVVNNGTASRLRTQYGLKIPIAGKTGTTQGHADGWFVGFTPALVAGAWVGADDRRIHFRSLDMG